MRLMNLVVLSVSGMICDIHTCRCNFEAWYLILHRALEFMFNELMLVLISLISSRKQN